MSGLTLTGFELETFDDLITGINADLLAAFGQSFDVSPDSPEGQIVAIFAERLSLLWELGQAINASQDPDVAEGQSLDAIGALRGVPRLAAAASTANEVLFGTNATIVPSGTAFSVVGTGARFAMTAPATIVTLAAWAAATPYNVGDLRSRVGNIYACTVAGTSGGVGPSGTGTAIVDGTVTWRFIAVGSAAVLAPVTAALTGPLIAAAGTMTVIETPVGGLAGAVNPLDAILGRDLETDSAYRLRQATLLGGQGVSTLNAIFAAVSAVAGIIDLRVDENTALTPNVDGVPGKAIEVVAEGGVDQAIIDAIGNTKAAGIQAYGQTVSGFYIDSQSISHAIDFTRPTQVPIYVRYDVTIDPATFPLDGDDQIKAACVAFGEALRIGNDVVFGRVSCVPFEITGVLDVVLTRTATTPVPTGTVNIPITSRQVADFDTSRVTVNHV